MTIGGCRAAPGTRYNVSMRRHLGPVAAAWLVAALSLVVLAALAPAVFADGRDPRCAAWEAGGAPPATDMAALCPPLTGVTTADADISSEPAFPYLVGLVVMATVLTGFGFVAMRLVAPSKPGARPRSAAEWWTCGECGATNQRGRGACFACQTARGPDLPATPAAPDSQPASRPV